MIWCHIANYAIIHFYIVHLSPEVLNTIFYNAQYIVLISACRHSKDITRLYFHKKFLTCILFVIVILWGGWSVHSVTGSIQRYILYSKLPPLVSKSFKSEKKKKTTNKLLLIRHGVTFFHMQILHEWKSDKHIISQHHSLIVGI